jgi:hypothetical protein
VRTHGRDRRYDHRKISKMSVTLSAFPISRVTPMNAMSPKKSRKQSCAAKLLVQEQAVVNEFAVVIRRHRDQGLVALARLARVAFELSISPKPSRQDRLALAMARGLEARQQLAGAEGGSLSSTEVASLLGISKAAVLRRLEAGQMVAWHEGRRQAARFPRWQFDRDGRLLVGLEEVLGILNRGERLDGWGKVLFFLLPQSSFGHKRPLELLREGRLEDARLAAEAYIA